MINNLSFNMHFETLSEISLSDSEPEMTSTSNVLDTKISNYFGLRAKVELETGKYSEDSEEYWKLKVAELVDSYRYNINLIDSPTNGLDLYVYDNLLEGMTSWKDYYKFLISLIIDHAQKNKDHHLLWIFKQKEIRL